MPLNPSRKFVISDVMAVIAAAAVGIALIRATFPDDAWMVWDPNVGSAPGMRKGMMIHYVLSCVLPFLVAWTPVLLFLRFRQPRPRLRRVFLQPGTVACVVATLAMTIEAVWIVSLLAVGSRFLQAETLFTSFAPQVSFAVLGGWSALVLSGRWRPESSWIDLAGRITGLVWLAATAVTWTNLLLF
jgi:hypothetical protein